MKTSLKIGTSGAGGISHNSTEHENNGNKLDIFK
jgi:hypothetical protein